MCFWAGSCMGYYNKIYNERGMSDHEGHKDVRKEQVGVKGTSRHKGQ